VNNWLIRRAVAPCLVQRICRITVGSSAGSQHHCEIAGTKMWSGVALEATCTVKGAEMTNEDITSPGITHNTNGIFSALWYRCIRADGKVGYLSEVYVAPAYRGGGYSFG
jgi:hypothetical protein